ncbi:MAG: aromatic amino acid lyase, partial [Syntrophomonadaceae bacterium]|nr:aromatic amino acid lyase [Syntrophomonadaceae bacterium]
MITLTGNSLTIKEVERVLYGYEEICLDEASLEKVDASRQVVEKIVAEEQLVYGITTGFGKFSDVLVRSEYVEELQLNLIHSHACGVGEKFPEMVSRAMLLLRANTLLKGFSGVRRELIQMLVSLLNARIHPVIPQQGSLGASGDLIPLAHLALALLGEGEVAYRGKICPAIEALNAEGLKPITLQAKEGLALINGTQAMTAMGVLAYLEAERLAYQAEFIASISIEGLQGITDAFDEEVQLARGYQEQVEVARRIRKILEDSQLTTHAGELRVQDAYS